MLPKLGSKGIDNLAIYVIGSTKRHPGGSLPWPLTFANCFINIFVRHLIGKLFFCAPKSFPVINLSKSKKVWQRGKMRNTLDQEINSRVKRIRGTPVFILVVLLNPQTTAYYTGRSD